jgi:hypothetical protein
MPRFQLVIDNGSLTGITGHHVIQCHIEETQDDGTIVHGVPKTWGIEATGLRLKHAGSAESWREWVAQEMLREHKARTDIDGTVMTWNRKKFDIPNT